MWLCTQIFEGHSYYVMQVTINPKDTNTFASASLDRTIKTLEGHTHNISAVIFHPELPIIITGSEDGTVQNTLNYGLERVWAVGCMKGSRRVVFGYDEGTIMVKIGREEPVVSMDNSGKIIWSKHNEIQTVNIKIILFDDLLWTYNRLFEYLSIVMGTRLGPY
ncbi:hypothetical protein LXL04_007286 [Taraxacum kok-saghyz]